MCASEFICHAILSTKQYFWHILPSFKLKSSWFVSTCLLSECLENICGKKKMGKRGGGGERIMSAVLFLLLDYSLEKKRGQETKKHIGFAWKNAALAGEGRWSRMQLPWYFIHQLIYGLHTALNNPPLSRWARALGSLKVVQTPEAQAETQRSELGEPPVFNSLIY